MHKSVIGRYWYAIGYNESAARYSGISTDRYRLIGFVICSFLASLCGVMLLLDYGTANPTDAGEMWELYAITGAVLGGCSLAAAKGRSSAWSSGRWCCRCCEIWSASWTSPTRSSRR